MSNKVLTEDYVSYEIAKLLKEKGFDECCGTAYTTTEGYPIRIMGATYSLEKNSDYDEFHYSMPTQSLAIKWLREVHNLHIEIYRTACGYLYIVSNIPYGTDLYNPEYGGDDENSGQWTTYEKCVEAALKYTLENLI